MAEQLGVKIFYGVNIGVDKTIEDLHQKEGYELVFLGNGLYRPKQNIGEIYDTKKNIFNSKTFLPLVSE